MRAEMWLKLGQILGFALMAASVAVYVMNKNMDLDRSMLMSALMALGMLVYAGCRLTAWLREK